MKTKDCCFRIVMVVLLLAAYFVHSSFAEEAGKQTRQQRAVEYARIMSRVKWTPVAGGMPNRRGGAFEQGTEYTGVPYSSVKAVGRDIGFDIYLKTFLAAVENPESVLYTENLSGEVSNAATYYGKVCSTFTSYALQCAIPYRSSHHGPTFREGVVPVEPQSAQAAQPGDVIYTPPATPGGGSHVELVTGVERSGEKVTAVRIEESTPPTTRNTLRKAAAFNAHIAARNRKLFRITDPDAWHGQNQAESFLFPNYDEDSATPAINRVLLLDRGDWVPYFKDQPVKFNVMDRDSNGVQSLIVKRGDAVVEQIPLDGKGVIERLFSDCGDYTAHCVMSDGSPSQACEFAVCDLNLSVPDRPLPQNQPWKIEFAACNLNVIALRLMSPKPPYKRAILWPTEEDRKNGTVTVPADLLQTTGPVQVWLIGENRYGRLTRQQEVAIAEEKQSAEVDSNRKPPNVLFIAVDDLRPQLACYGHTQMVTPRLDALAASGARFAMANCMVPVCGASRASLMTGLRPKRNRFVGWNCWAERDAPTAVPLNTHLTQHGYYAVSLGKVFHHGPDHAAGWSEEPWRPNLPDRFCDCYVLPESLEAERRHRQGNEQSPRTRFRGPCTESADVPDEAYTDGKTAERAVADMRRLAANEQPFLLAVGFVRPHLPFIAPKRYWDLYDAKDIHLPENYGPPKNCPPDALNTWGELRAYSDIPHKGPLPDETALRLIHGYYACVSYIDAQVGKLLDELDHLKLADNTIVVLWGDHGWQLGEHGLWCKHTCFETSMHGVLLVRVPGMPKEVVCSQPVEFIDIYPSLCELAGLPLPGRLQGRSFVPLLRGESDAARQDAIGRYGRGETIRTPQYRYTEYLDAKNQVNARMLYNHQADPAETVNIVDNPALHDVIDQMSQRLKAARAAP